jgi:3-oxoadipate enol-lactonase
MLGLPATIGDAAHGVVYREDILSELSDTSVPVLAIAGQEDHAYEAGLSQHIADTVPQGRWVTVDRAGHSLAVECPDAVNRHLAQHFASTTFQSSNFL